MLTLKPFFRRSWSVDGADLCRSHLSCRTNLHFHCAQGFTTLVLAHMLDSLVRVSRRGNENHFVSITMSQIPKSQGTTLHLDTTHTFQPKAFNSDGAYLPTQRFCDQTYRCDTRPRHSAKLADEICTQPTLVPFASLSAISGTFNSLFKVLFIFPSRYLFAIGLPPIFSFRWNLPPTLSCNPKQLDSLKSDRTHTNPRHRRDSHPLCCPVPRDLTSRLQLVMPL